MDLVIRLGYKSAGSITRYVSSTSPHLRADRLVAMLDTAEYELVFKDKSGKDSDIVVNMKPSAQKILQKPQKQEAAAQKENKDRSIILTDTGTGYIDSQTGREITEEDFEKFFAEINKQ